MKQNKQIVDDLAATWYTERAHVLTYFRHDSKICFFFHY